MKCMLDTNTLIYLAKNKPPAVAQRLNALGEEDTICMSFVTYAELLKGAEGSTRRTEVVKLLHALVRQVPVAYATGAAICEHYATHAVRLRARGTPIGSNDLWIAAHALAESAVLVTNNEGEFGRIDGLVIENWVR